MISPGKLFLTDGCGAGVLEEAATSPGFDFSTNVGRSCFKTGCRYAIWKFMIFCRNPLQLEQI
jgi:hypothetical protein